MARNAFSTIMKVSKELNKISKASARNHQRHLLEGTRQVRELERQNKLTERLALKNVKEERKIYIESRYEEVQQKNEQLNSELAKLAKILTSILNISTIINFNKLIKENINTNLEKIPVPPINPQLDDFLPKKLSWLFALFPWIKTAYQKKLTKSYEN